MLYKENVLYFSLRRYFTQINKWDTVCVLHICVVVHFYPWFKFYFPLFWGMVMSLKQKEIKFKLRIKLTHNICIAL